MESYRFIVLSNPVSGREDEYNDWYSNRHIQDVVEAYGFTAAQRFVLASDPRNPAATPEYQYMAIYEMETDNLAKSLADLGVRKDTDDMPLTNALKRPVATMIVKPISPRVVRKDSD
jgi:hypothetical protein